MKYPKLLLILAIFTLVIANGYAQEPVHDGQLSVSGLNDTVEILRDNYGIPHIYASNTYDLFFAQGYTQAQDRWWQMEFNRHTGSGTTQELIGQTEALMGIDVYLRTLGFRDIAERELAETYSEETIAGLQAFADGVNAYILDGKTPGQLATQYNLLRLSGIEVEIEEWTPVDTIIWGKLMMLDLGGNEGYERLLSRLYANIDAELLDDWNVEWPFGQKPTIVWAEELPASTTNASIESDNGIIGLDIDPIGDFVLDNAYLPFVTGPGIGSNNWVAGGAITESGSPLMANDMHLGLSMPSIWYEIGLHCMPVSEECPFNVTGFTFSPSPTVIAGHNDYISWAHTNVGPDTQDLYQIHVNPDNDFQYEWNGEWRDMTVREETINFGDGAEPISFQVRITHLGPIMNDTLEGFNNEDPVALRWTALEPGTLFEAVIELNQATNWDDFRAALAKWDAPSQNIIYADIEGNIGYQVPGRIPIRAAGHTGLLPIPGWADEYEWRGYIPYDYLPRLWNPERNYIATANQAVVPKEYYDWLAQELGDEFGTDSNYYLDHIWAFGYRGDRINTLLEELAPHNADTFQQIHGDNYDGTAPEILPFVFALELEDDALLEARDWLAEWDYQMHMESGQAALYAFFWRSLMNNLYNDQFGDVYQVGGNGNNWWATYLLAQDPENAWWDDVNTDVVETRDDILLRSFEEAVSAATETLGNDKSAWRWGDLHTITFVSNPLGASGIAMVENMVNRGPFPVSGTGNAVNAMGWNAAGDFTSRAGPSERVIYDLSNWDNSLSVHPTGQSGHPTSDHYEDMIDMWRHIEYHPMLWSREQVEAATVSTLILTPAN